MLELRSTFSRFLSGWLPSFPDRQYQAYFKTPEEIEEIYRRLSFAGQSTGLALYMAPGVTEIPMGQTDTRYPDENPHLYPLLASPRGAKLLQDPAFFHFFEGDPKKHPHMTLVDDNSGNRTWSFPYRGKTYFLKINQRFGTAPYEFMGMHLLATEGVHISPLILASRGRYLTEAVSGVHASSQNQSTQISEYVNRVHEAKQRLDEKGLWIPEERSARYLLDVKPKHLFVRDLQATNPLDWFTLIDGVYFSPTGPWHLSASHQR